MAQNPEHPSKSRAQLVDIQPHSMYSNNLNNSTSKMQYSIPKNARFRQQKAKLDYKYYDLPSMLSERSASFGYGDKLDLSKSNSKTPPPNTYHLVSDFEGRRSNAIAIGLGRELVKAVSVFDTRASKVPGPGAYNAKELPSRQNVLLASRVQDFSMKWVNEVPGPGTYKTMELLDKNLKSNLSKFASCRAGRFSKGEERGDFQKMQKKKNIPGPGQYQTIAHHEVIEKFPQHRGRSFSKGQRPSIANKSCAPGPGSYKYLSQFMH